MLTHRWPIDPMDMGMGPVDGPGWPWSLDCNLPFQLPITSFTHPSSLWDSRSCTYSRINRHAQDSKYPSWQVFQHFIAITWTKKLDPVRQITLIKTVVDFSLKNVFAIAATLKLSKRNSGQTQDWPLAKLQSPFPASLSLPPLVRLQSHCPDCNLRWQSPIPAILQYDLQNTIASESAEYCPPLHPAFAYLWALKVKEVLRLQHCNESCWTHWPLNFMWKVITLALGGEHTLLFAWCEIRLLW